MHFARAGAEGGFLHRALFDFGDAAGHRDDDARARLKERAAVMHLVDEVPQHRLGDLEIGDDAILQRADGDDIARRAAEHALGFVADREHMAGADLHRDHRGFAQDDAVIFDVNQGVGRSQIDADVVGEQPKKSIKHSKGKPVGKVLK